MVGCRYSLYTLPGQRIPGGLWRMRARARTRPTGRSPSISHSIRQARLPHPLASTHLLVLQHAHSDSQGSVSRRYRYSVSAILRLTLRILAFNARRAPVGFSVPRNGTREHELHIQWIQRNIERLCLGSNKAIR